VTIEDRSHRSPRFLAVDDILKLHAIAIGDQDGDSSIRDRSMLDSATAMPAQQFDGRYLHVDIPAMAAAYAFHLCQNHPFVDGNKRTAALSMIAFLSDNGWSFDAPTDDAEEAFLQLASGQLGKSEFTDWSREHMREKPRMELRDFFAQVEPAQFTERFLSLLPGQTHADPKEFAQRVNEVMPVMPLMQELARQQEEADRKGDKHGWDRLTMLAVGMLTLHALAEDMGYEW